MFDVSFREALQVLEGRSFAFSALAKACFDPQKAFGGVQGFTVNGIVPEADPGTNPLHVVLQCTELQIGGLWQAIPARLVVEGIYLGSLEEITSCK